MRTFVAIWTAISLAFIGGDAIAAGCEPVEFEGTSFTVCSADPKIETVGLALDDGSGQRLGTFDRLAIHLNIEPSQLGFAMNGGMYHPDRAPVGLYIEEGAAKTAIVTRSGPGNFGLLPNGVLCLFDERAEIIESRAFANETPACRYATQSGPMLVIDGALHPRFLEDSTSEFVRNGVGVDTDGTLFAVISDRPVNFHRFGRFFRDVLKTPNALFLDGRVSRLFAPGLGRNDFGFPMGPMLYALPGED